MPSTELQQRQACELTAEQLASAGLAVHALLEIQEHIKQLEKDAAALKAMLEEFRVNSGSETFDVDGYRVTRVVATRQVLNKEKLLLAGLTTAQLQDATDTVPTKPYTLVTKVKA